MQRINCIHAVKPCNAAFRGVLHVGGLRQEEKSDALPHHPMDALEILISQCLLGGLPRQIEDLTKFSSLFLSLAKCCSKSRSVHTV